MVIKHYVWVDFLSWQPTWERKVGEPELERQRLTTLDKYLIPSLENQTLKDFTLLMCIGEQLSGPAREHLAGLNTSFPVIFGEHRTVNRELEKAWAENDVVITSRMADDDMPWKGAAAEVQRIAKQGLPFVVHGYRRGLVYVEGKGITEWRYPNDQGQLAIFMSLIRTTEAQPMTIKTFGNHTRVRTTVETNYKQYGIDRLPEGWWNSDDTTDPAWVYVRHKNAISGKRHIEKNKWGDLGPDLTPLEDFGWKRKYTCGGTTSNGNRH